MVQRVEVRVPDGLKHRECLPWALQFDCCRRWLAKLQQQPNRAYYLYRFCKAVGLNPEQFLELKRKGGFKAEMVLDRFVADNLDGSKGITNSVLWNCVNTVKSFCLHNYLDLARKSGKVDLVKVKPYRRPSHEDLRKLYKAAGNPRDRCLLLFACSGIAKETLMKVTWSHLEADWEDQDIPHIDIDAALLKGHGRGKWKGVEQHTFLTPEGKEELLFYREWLRLKHIPIGPKTPIFISVQRPYEPLTKSTLEAVVNDWENRSGVKFSLHDGRRYIQTILESQHVNPNWIQKIKGRKVKGEQNPYSQPAIEELRSVFREAVPQLSFLSEESQSTKQAIKELKETLGEETLERKRALEELAKQPKVSDEEAELIFALREFAKDKRSLHDLLEWFKQYGNHDA